MKKFYMMREFKARLIQLVPNDIITSICGIHPVHPENQDVVDDTAKKKRMVWKLNARMAQLTWNDIGEAVTRDHERLRSVLLIRLQVKELMTSMTNEYYQRAKKRHRNGKRRVRRIIANLSRKRKRDRTYHHRAIASIEAKLKTIQYNSEIRLGSQPEQSHRITQICDITGKKHNFEFIRTSRNDVKEDYKRINASNLAVTKEIENELGITVNDGDGNSDQ
ncbi:7599_t:CDS:2 [Acaulospora morrowiae]|uniref:7599_t:CDS:1 n=1 Tax=Acaulospora morrowiae TaxID=94023 RepID=A0A9N9FQ94_9GLOM|nr:7599_t:CDS:2 [Acaulospora morrowiae]